MKSHWKKLLLDESGVVISSELALVGTVGVLGMVVGLEAVTSSVNSELNDLASAFGTLDQTFSFRSIGKPGHAFVRGAGFNDRGDFCDCIPIVQTDVFGKTGVGGFSETTGFSQSLIGPSAVVGSSAVVSQGAVVNSGPVVREQVIEERVVNEVLVEPRAVQDVCPDDDIIEEHIIIRRRARTDCDCSATTKLVPKSKIQQLQPKGMKPEPQLDPIGPKATEKVPTEAKPKPKKKG